MKPTKLKKFLINRNLFEAFKTNYGVQGIPFTQFINKYQDSEDAICRAFFWNRTYEKGLFWSKISGEWRKCLKYNKL